MRMHNTLTGLIFMAMTVASCGRNQSTSEVNNADQETTEIKSAAIDESKLYYKYPLITFEGSFMSHADYDSGTTLEIGVDNFEKDKPLVLKTEYSNSRGYHRTYTLFLSTGKIGYEEGQAGNVEKKELNPASSDSKEQKDYLDMLGTMKAHVESIISGSGPWDQPHPELEIVKKYLEKVIDQVSKK
ncbi:MAG: hypothetical protein HQK54_04435 [Oligoflexales bacterium]|nr:hypothetical protein [Oligoflexales bacterium]